MEVTVVKEGKRGVLGLGAEEAVVKVQLLAAAPEKAEKPPKPKKAEKPAKPKKPEKAEKPKKVKEPEKPKEAEELEEPEKPEKPKKLDRPEAAGDLAGMAASVLETLLTHLELKAQVAAEMKPPLGGEGAQVIALNVKGDDLGILIGRRGQTRGEARDRDRFRRRRDLGPRPR